MSLRKDGSWVRKQRMTQITKYLVLSLVDGNKISMNKLFAWIACNIGLTRPKAKSYVHEIAVLYDWQIKDGFIFNPQKVTG